MAPTPGMRLNLSFVSTASKDRLRRVTTSRNRVAVRREELLHLFLLALFWSSCSTERYTRTEVRWRFAGRGEAKSAGMTG